MNRQRVYDLLNEGDGLSATDISTYKLPSIPTALAALGTITAKYVVGPTSKTIITLTGAVLSELSTNQYGTLYLTASTQSELLDFAVGQNIVHGCWASLAFTKATGTITTGAIDYALGSVIATNTTLSSTMVDLCPSTTTASLSATVGTYTAAKAGRLAAAATFNGTTTGGASPLYTRMFLNIAAPSTGACTLKVTGTITLVSTFVGDY